MGTPPSLIRRLSRAGLRRDVLAMGRLKPWPDGLEAFTGSRELDGSAVIACFAPLMDWLREQNADRRCGW